MASDADDVTQLVDDVHQRAAALGDDADLAELLTPEFMERYAATATVEQFLAESPWPVESAADFADVPEDEFDDYVAAATAFDSWDAMLEVAGREWVARQFGL